MGFADTLSQNEETSQTVNYNNKKKELCDKEKQEATEQHRPWVTVLDTNINEDDIKNGFFELDWNEAFIELLLDEGYSGESQEEIVEKWFNSIIFNILQEEGMEPAEFKSGNVVNFLKQ